MNNNTYMFLDERIGLVKFFEAVDATKGKKSMSLIVYDLYYTLPPLLQAIWLLVNLYL